MKKRILTLGILLALLVALVIPASIAVAAPTGTSEGTGTMEAASIDVTAPGAFGFGTFAIGDNLVAATDGSIVVTPGSTDAAGYSVTAKDENTGGDSGYMLTAGTPLTNELLISDDDGGSYSVASTGLTYANAASLTGVISFDAKQVITGAETVGAYAITIEFAGTVTF